MMKWYEQYSLDLSISIDQFGAKGIGEMQLWSARVANVTWSNLQRAKRKQSRDEAIHVLGEPTTRDLKTP